MFKRNLRRKLTNQLMYVLSLLCIVIALIPLISILFEVISNGISAIDSSFLIQIPKPVGEPGGGIANAIQGTFILIGLACLIGLPIGLFSGVYLAEHGNNKFSKFVRFITEVLSGIPSIVMGLFIFALVVLPMGHFSAIAGGIVLGIMMIPTVTITSQESVQLVSTYIREASIALGVPLWKTTLKVVLSTAKKGVITGILLAIARISGETAPLLFTAFGNMYWSSGLAQPIASIPLLIYTYAISPFPEWHTKAWGAAFILILIIFGLSLSMRILMRGKTDAG
jgi:phosphate transport system permease protein